MTYYTVHIVETGQISVPYFSGSGFLLITDLTVISRQVLIC